MSTWDEYEWFQGIVIIIWPSKYMMKVKLVSTSLGCQMYLSGSQIVKFFISLMWSKVLLTSYQAATMSNKISFSF